MGLENVWQIFGWAGFVVFLPAVLSNILPDTWYTYYATFYKTKRLGIPPLAYIALWALASVSLAYSAFRTHDIGGGWVELPIELLFYVFFVVMANYFVPIYFFPCKTKCTNVASYLFVTLGVGVITFILFVHVDTLAAFFLLPFGAIVFYSWLLVWQDEMACKNRHLPKWFAANRCRV